MNRRFDAAPRDDVRYPPRPGAYVIINAGDALLASFQDGPVPELQLPGGGVDPGEGTLAAVHREVLEETGYRIHGLRRLGMFHRYTFMPDYDRYAHKLCSIYTARVGPRVGPPTEPGHMAVFLPWAVAVDRLAVAGDRAFVARYIATNVR